MQSRKKKIFYIIVVLVLAVFLFIIYKYQARIGRILSPILMAVIIAYLIKPIVLKLEKYKIPRSVGILTVYLVVLIGSVLIIIFLVPELVNNTKELSNTLPDITVKYQNIFNDLMSVIRSSKWPPEIKNAIFNEVQNGMAIAQNFVADTLKKILVSFIQTVTVLFDLALSMFVAYYLIKDGDHLRDMFLSLTPRKWRDGLAKTGRDINKVMSDFIQGQLLDALIVGILETIGLIIVGVRYPLVLGMIGGLANIIPYFGPIIGAIPAVAVALIQSPIKLIWTVLIFVLVQQLDSACISSKIIEGKLGLHPLTTIIVVLIGGEFFGIMGMLLSVPITAALKIIVKRAVEAIV
ncbi:MAG: AI-2E family transporter [Bacillota bacterium]|nr:AI-2E family transporter [Bacillota bacterium]